MSNDDNFALEKKVCNSNGTDRRLVCVDIPSLSTPSTPLPSPTPTPPTSTHKPKRPPVTTSPQHPLTPKHRTLLEKTHAFGIRFGMRPTLNLPKRWRSLSDDQELLQAARACEEVRGRVFTLNLSPKVEAEARKSTNPKRYISERFRKNFKKHGVSSVPYAFKFEISPTGRLHVHGCIHPHEASDMAVRRAFLDSAGKVPGKDRARVLSVQLFASVLGSEGLVGNYLAKSKAASKELPGAIIFLSRPMRKIAQEFHERGDHACLSFC